MVCPAQDRARTQTHAAASKAVATRQPPPKATRFGPEPIANRFVTPASVGSIRAFSCKIPLDAPCDNHYTLTVAHKHKWGPPCVLMS